MKKLILLLLFLILTSCVDNKQKLFYDFMDDKMIETINMSAKDLKLEIISIEFSKSIVAKDSIEFYSERIKEVELNLNNNKVELTKVDKNIDRAESQLRAHIMDKASTRDSYTKYILDKAIKNREEFIELQKEQIAGLKSLNESYQLELNYIKPRLEVLNTNSEEIINNEYKVTLSMFMPDEKLRKTMKMIAYTNSDDTKFIAGEL